MAALFRMDGTRVERPLVEAMLATMPYRGPHGRGIWTEDGIGLGHLALHATPRSLHDDQPLVRGDLALTADCRIDNRAELFAALAVPTPHDQVSDAALILLAYQRWGEDCAQHLLGDFAFVLWDGERRRVLCARDHFGVKPLYYYRSGALFACASEIKALLALPGVPRRVDEVMIADHLMGVFDDAGITYWQHIRRLPAGHSMIVRAEGDRRRRYWKLDPRRETRLGSDEEYAATLRRLFIAAVERRLSSPDPVGSALSGGLDSTSVACTAAMLAREAGRPAPHSFSLVYDGLPGVDERRWIEPALQWGQFIPHFIGGDQIDPLAMLDDMLFHQDGIFYTPNLYLHDAMYAEAARSGVRVFLDGLDGDSTLSHGLDYPRELVAHGRLLAALRETRALARRRGRSTVDQARRLFPLHTGMADRVRTFRGRLRGVPVRPVPPPWNQFGILSPDLERHVGARSRYEMRSSHRQSSVWRERTAHYLQISWPLQTFALESADRAAAAHGIEPRYPFFDVPLVEFCLSLPGDQKLRDGWTRWIMRKAMEGILPPEVQWRHGKSNMGPVLTTAIARHGRPTLEGLLAHPDRIAPYVDLAALRAVWERFVATPRPADIMSLWLPLALDRGLAYIAKEWGQTGGASGATPSAMAAQGGRRA